MHLCDTAKTEFNQHLEEIIGKKVQGNLGRFYVNPDDYQDSSNSIRV